MTDSIAGLPFWEVRFDAGGDPDSKADEIVKDIQSHGITDLFAFSHGWNNSPEVARRLYDGWFGQLAPQLSQARSDRPVKVGLVGIFWPSLLWSDEPIPDFKPVAAADSGGGAAAAAKKPTVMAATPEIDATALKELKKEFPKAADTLDRMAELLAAPPTSVAAKDFMEQLRTFADQTAVTGSASSEEAEKPGMLDDEPDQLFARFVAALRQSGVTIDDGGGGAAGLGDVLSGIWHGAKEALRQTTYWQMKGRAGVVGEKGLGPFIDRLHDAMPDLRINLVGHSFGARLVSFSLAGVRSDPSPVKSVTLLQGAFSHFTFSDALPFDASRGGALKGKLSRIDGPLTVCYSSHDSAVGTFYPIASRASGEDAAGAQSVDRWGGMGHDGAQSVSAGRADLQSAGPEAKYTMAAGKVLNIDCSDIVRNGPAPSGAHSDIVHPELTWVALKAAQVVT